MTIFVQLKEYVGNASKLSQRGPLFSFCFLNVTYKTGWDERVPLSFFFGAVRFFANFSCLKRTPSILLESSLVISGIKRYIRTFDVIPELYCIFVRRRRRSENGSFSRKLPTHISNLRFLSLRYGTDFRRSRLVTLSQNYQARKFCWGFLALCNLYEISSNKGSLQVEKGLCSV